MNNIIKSTMGIIVSTAIATVIGGCSFDGLPGIYTADSLNELWARVSLTLPYDKNLYTVYEDDLFQVRHGASCASAVSAASKDNAGKDVYGIGIQERIFMPARYDSATVFLNGWRMRYKNSDHEVLGLSTAIVDIEKDDDHLQWTAGGILSDGDGDDGFAWCYNYTALFWKSHPDNLDAEAFDSDDGSGLTVVSNTSRQGFQRTPNTLVGFDKAPGALLPRGFGVIWIPYRDHHLRKFALKYGDFRTSTWLDGSEHNIFWSFDTYFADEERNTYYAAEVVSVLSGDSVDEIQGDFSIDLNKSLGSPGYHDVVANTFVIPDIPYDYAVPMLTGWNIGLNSNQDSHIKDIGVWIESFDYDKRPGASTGTLTYTIKSVFHDKESNGAGRPEYQVGILGFNPKGLILGNPTTGTVNEDPRLTPTRSKTAVTTNGLDGSRGGNR